MHHQEYFSVHLTVHEAVRELLLPLKEIIKNRWQSYRRKKLSRNKNICEIYETCFKNLLYQFKDYGNFNKFQLQHVWI